MRGAELGKRSLMLDAAYCAVAGSLTAILRRQVGSRVGLSPRATAAGGIATVAWAGALAALSGRAQQRWPAAVVGTVNALTALALTTAGARHRQPVGRLLLVAGGLEVAAFAASQAAALLTAARPTN